MGDSQDRFSLGVDGGRQIAGIVLGCHEGAKSVKDQASAWIQVTTEYRLISHGLTTETQDGVLDRHGRAVVASGNIPLRGASDKACLDLLEGQATFGVVVDRFGLGAEGATATGTPEAGYVPVSDR
jgi:hypothetical protein